MSYQLSEVGRAYLDRLHDFIETELKPRTLAFEQARSTEDRWQVNPVIEECKTIAKAAGMWNLFMPPSSPSEQLDSSFQFDGPSLSNLDYAYLAEQMGHEEWYSEVFNCSAPDSGNMEVLHRYGTRSQKDKWLAPLMEGKTRSAFLMTEPDVASSDATNIKTSIRRDGDHYTIDGRKWWSSGVGDPRCSFAILMGKTNPDAPAHQQQSQILVPMNSPGVRVERMLDVFGYDDAPHGHGEVVLTDVRVPAENLVLGEGRGFEIAQGRLGPGRLHHCMRTIGTAEVALEKMCTRLLSRKAFGKNLFEHSIWEERVAHARIEIEKTRLLCLKAAHMLDTVGNKVARGEIAMIKVAAPRMVLQILDDAIQAHGGAGVTGDHGLARAYAGLRTLRIADGPDEVHNRTISRLEFKKHTRN